MLTIPNGLLAVRIMQDTRLSSASKALYHAMTGHVKTTSTGYARAFDIPEGAVRRCLAELHQCGWIYSFRNPAHRRLVYVPWMPLDLEDEVAAAVEQRVDSAANRGEFIMKLLLDTLVNDPHYADNVRLRWTRVGTEHQRLEFDRYYMVAKVAIEFHGRQHYETVQFRNKKSDLRDQQIRDGLKALACLRQGVTLIEIADIELSYETLVAKLTGHLPLLPVTMNRPLVRVLANMADEHSNWARDQRVGG